MPGSEALLFPGSSLIATDPAAATVSISSSVVMVLLP